MVFLCQLCNDEKEESEVIIFRCTHVFCWECIEKYIIENLSNKFKCPLPTCGRFIRDSEVRMVLSDDDITKYETYCLNNFKHKHNCVLCDEICFYDNEDVQYDCKKCTIFNCIKCQEAHKGMKCEDTVTVMGESRQFICQRETLRARQVLKKIESKCRREHLIKMESAILVSNPSAFVCQICIKCVCKCKGITLRQCFHQICRSCLEEHVKSCQTIPVVCPFSDCKSTLDDRECREILPEFELKVFESRCLSIASKELNNAVRCLESNCTYLCDLDKSVTSWTCSLCNCVNCVSCHAVHKNKTCQQYMESRITQQNDPFIMKLIEEKKLMKCLTCHTLLNKISGCNWIQCPSCNTELCWINQTFRWGPKGRGDESAGCKCGVNGIKCHPECSSCNPHRECHVM